MCNIRAKMNSSFANSQLELACRVASSDDVIEALEDGADIDCNGSSPLFLAIGTGSRELIQLLLERGAETSLFQISSDEKDAVDKLLALVPPLKGSNPGEEIEIDPKVLRAFDRMVLKAGLLEPIRKNRKSDYEAFAAALEEVAAESCYAIVREFLTDTADKSETDLLSISTSEADEKYRAASEEEEPRELLKQYLKELKKR